MSDIADKFKYGAAALWDFLTSKTGLLSVFRRLPSGGISFISAVRF